MSYSYFIGKRIPAICRDQIKRSAVVTGYADTWWTIPAAVQVTSAGKRRTVAGCLSHDVAGVIRFTAYLYKANHTFIPWTNHRPRLAAVALRLIKATAYGRGAPGYLWDWPADHARAISGGCRHFYGTSAWPQGGFAAQAILRRLPVDLLPRLAMFFERLARFQELESPPPPPLA